MSWDDALDKHKEALERGDVPQSNRRLPKWEFTGAGLLETMTEILQDIAHEHRWLYDRRAGGSIVTVYRTHRPTRESVPQISFRIYVFDNVADDVARPVNTGSNAREVEAFELVGIVDQDEVTDRVAYFSTLLDRVDIYDAVEYVFRRAGWDV